MKKLLKLLQGLFDKLGGIPVDRGPHDPMSLVVANAIR
jgi:hypothetical protein